MHYSKISSLIKLHRITLLLLLSFNAYSGVSTIYVDIDAAPGGDGISWATAYDNLHDALLDAAPGDQVWVAEGVYYPDVGPGQIDNDRFSSFNWTSGNLFGGFNGTENDINQRDPLNNKTILSGDIDGDDVVDADGITVSTVDIRSSNAYHIVTAGNVAAGSIMDGFFITGGNSSGLSPDDTGSAIQCINSVDLTFENMTVQGNFVNSRAVVRGCTNSVFFDSSFINNRAGDVGAITVNSMAFNNVLFMGNRADSQGSLFYMASANLNLTNCVVINNSDGNNGAIRFQNGNLTIVNSVFSGNTASSRGSAVDFSGSASGFITNSTFTGNNSGGSAGGTIRYGASGTLEIFNSIFWNNEDNSGVGTLDSNIIVDGAGTVTVSSSLLQGSGGSAGWIPTSIVDGGNNLDADPTFVDPVDPLTAPTAAGDTRLTSFSPAIDTGDSLQAFGPFDLAGNQRIVGSAVDMGAFETQQTTDLSISKTDGVTSVEAGTDNIVYTIVVSNIGAQDVDQALVSDVLPAGLNCTWSVSFMNGSAGNSAGTGDINEIISLPNGSSATYTVDCDTTNAEGPITNTASVAIINGTDSNNANNTATDADTVVNQPPADLSISKEANTSAIVAGNTLSYTIIVSNNGTGAASNVNVLDEFPNQTPSCNINSQAENGATGNTTFQLGASGIDDDLNLPNGSSVTYFLNCGVAVDASGIISNTAELVWAGTDPDTSNNSATAETTIINATDFTITNTNNVDTVQVGDSVTYTIQVTNNGSIPVFNVEVSNPFPAELGNCKWSCTAQTDFTCNTTPTNGDLLDIINADTGGTATYEATCTVVSADATDNVTSRAEVTPPLGFIDVNLGDNRSTDTDLVILFANGFE